VSGGLAAGNLPTAAGWERIYTAVQLYADGFAPALVFSGGGTNAISEAEVYAEAAGWLGVPREAIAIDPHPNNTAEHPASILRIPGIAIESTHPLDIVTSPLHSRRVALSFKKGGFTNFRVVTSWAARRQNTGLARERRLSAYGSFRASGKSYNDALNTLRWRLDYSLETARELAALGWYWSTGRI
jgi:uncharacterized SAM-binding protein YcdF (DUF218 family)